MRIVYRIYFADQDESSDRFNDMDYASEADAEAALREYFQQHPRASFSFIVRKVYTA